MNRIVSSTLRTCLRSAAAVRSLFPTRSGPRILTYHSVRPNGPGPRSAYVHPADFESQIRYILDQGYEVVSLSRLVNAIRSNHTLPNTWVCITFDDGYADNYEYAFPVLKKFGLPATVFLVSGKINRDPRFLTLTQIEQMSSHGIEFGSHTVDHVSLSSVPLAEARRQILESKRQLEDLLQAPVEHFCYPYGHFNEAVDHFVREAGYRSCCTEQAGAISLTTDPFRLVRVGVLGTDTLADFALKVHGAYDWWVNSFMAIQEWRRRRQAQVST